jgi:hypothetical protein
VTLVVRNWVGGGGGKNPNIVPKTYDKPALRAYLASLVVADPRHEKHCMKFYWDNKVWRVVIYTLFLRAVLLNEWA